MNKTIDITGFIDGLPSSYDSTYVIRTKKRCPISNVFIIEKDINSGNVIFIDGIGFCLKKELINNSIEYQHLRDGDRSSPAFVLKKVSL